MTWNDSRLACQRYGGDLVVIRDVSVQNFLVSNMTPVQRRQHYWIGLTDSAREGIYTFAHMAPFMYTIDHNLRLLSSQDSFMTFHFYKCKPQTHENSCM